jgi:hypothetical protein
MQPIAHGQYAEYSEDQVVSLISGIQITNYSTMIVGQQEINQLKAIVRHQVIY